jgi:dethiobiotin synthetase
LYKINIFANLFQGGNKNVNGIFITGTDTDVGKTYTALGIIEAAKSNGMKVAAMKPWETGCRQQGKRLIPSDAVRLMKASGMRDINRVNPCRFRTPVAPYVAGQLENRPVAIDKIKKTYHELSLQHDLVVVEGAGGLLVPITKIFSYADLAKELSLPILVVSANKLGVINHVLLTVDYIKTHGLQLLGVVMNNISKKDTVAKRTNAHTLSLLLGKYFLGEITFHQSNKDLLLYKKIFKLL